MEQCSISYRHHGYIIYSDVYEASEDENRPDEAMETVGDDSDAGCGVEGGVALLMPA